MPFLSGEDLSAVDQEEPAMAATSNRKSTQAKVSAHCRRLRAQGLRPIQIWVPDVRAPGFKAQALANRWRSRLASFIDAVSDVRLGEGLE
jgi:Protein  of unknown function (DUF3018)